MSNTSGPDLKSLQQSIEQLGAKIPPVEKWDPPLSGDMDMMIDRDGRWFHEGGEIKRQPLVKLFSSILKKEGEDYFLVTPVEKWRIRVSLAPLMVVAIESKIIDEQQVLVFTTSVDDQILLDDQHPIRLVNSPDFDETIPLVRVRHNLEAAIHRNQFYELVNHYAEPDAQDPKAMVVESCGSTFVLGYIG